MSSTLHECSGEGFPTGVNGEAIGLCYEHENGELWVGNSEYESQVSFCPYCGFKARVPAAIIPERRR